MSLSLLICKYCVLGTPRFLVGLLALLSLRAAAKMLNGDGDLRSSSVEDEPYRSSYSSLTTFVLLRPNKLPLGPDDVSAFALLPFLADWKDLAAKAMTTIQKNAGTP